MKDILLIFAKYPQPGACKTRLIPELGASGAAQLQERMTGWTLAWARQLSFQHEVTVEVHFHGANSNAMAAKFGSEWHYIPQVDGSLGDKLKSAVLQSFRDGAERVLVVGTDCPELSESHATQALQRLVSHEVCIAPSSDGGYTLVGIARQPAGRLEQILKALFDGISWGTELVMQQTLGRLTDTRAVLSLLPTLADVDIPADLGRGMQALAAQQPRPSLSVIIPVHGSEERLRRAIASAAAGTAVEVIVSASSETPSLADVAVELQTQLIYSRANRGHQLNAGAQCASSDVLLFLHADTELPHDYSQQISDALENPLTVGGAFALRIDSSRASMRLIEKGVALRTKFFRMPYGDQAIFVRASVFRTLNGFQEQPIMEDFEFVRRLKSMGSIVGLKSPVTTSARRWERLGPVRTTLKNQLMILGFYLGIPQERLARFYRGRR